LRTIEQGVLDGGLMGGSDICAWNDVGHGWDLLEQG
jgi:hypothetical protein